jgi:hypothetical protein
MTAAATAAALLAGHMFVRRLIYTFSNAARAIYCHETAKTHAVERGTCCSFVFYSCTTSKLAQYFDSLSTDVSH